VSLGGSTIARTSNAQYPAQRIVGRAGRRQAGRSTFVATHSGGLA